MANPSTAHEPSMEEILASIRQIISEDGEGSPVVREVHSADRDEPLARNEAEQKGLSEANASGLDVKAAGDTAMQPKLVEKPDAAPQSSAPQLEPSKRPEHPAGGGIARAASAAIGSQPARSPEKSEDRTLLSDHSDTAVAGAFSALAHTILAQNARTLEDLVVEMLRPMLKEWLDDNLPALVERLVKEEIERVSRGRR